MAAHASEIQNIQHRAGDAAGGRRPEARVFMRLTILLLRVYQQLRAKNRISSLAGLPRRVRRWASAPAARTTCCGLARRPHLLDDSHASPSCLLLLPFLPRPSSTSGIQNCILAPIVCIAELGPRPPGVAPPGFAPSSHVASLLRPPPLRLAAPPAGVCPHRTQGTRERGSETEENGGDWRENERDLR